MLIRLEGSKGAYLQAAGGLVSLTLYMPHVLHAKDAEMNAPTLGKQRAGISITHEFFESIIALCIFTHFDLTQTELNMDLFRKD